MNRSNRQYFIYLPIAFSIVLIAGIVLGSLLNRNNPIHHVISPPDRSNYGKVDDIIDYIEYNYVDTVKPTDLETTAIKEMLKELDPHSQYITVEEFHAVNDDLLGSFEGIGISFRIEKDTITVISPIPGGPSEKVGLMAGDRIVKIEDTLVAGTGITNNDAIRKLKGEKGTKVKVSIFRRGVPKLIDFTITRDVIPTYSLDVAYMVNDEIGYVKLRNFSATTEKEFKKAVKELMDEGMTKLILDLRGNPGGYLNAAISIADEFLPSGKLIVYTEGKNRPKNFAFATDRGNLQDKEVVILIDGGSASASEIVAGAIQDNDIGTIIGRRSFGKGLVQEQMNLPDGSALRLTVARYHTPTGRCIQRPYEEGFDEYYGEQFHRLFNGELQSADSIKFADSLKYTTPGGKIVYGGGGIMPDIFIPMITDSVHTYYNLLANKGLIFQFAFDYTDANRSKLGKYDHAKIFEKDYEMSNNEYADLVAYAEDKGIEATQEEIRVSKDKVKILFKAFVGRNILDEKGFYPIYHKIDTTFKRAVYELQMD
jgi:carboxyl-terminal processing protease